MSPKVKNRLHCSIAGIGNLSHLKNLKCVAAAALVLAAALPLFFCRAYAQSAGEYSAVPDTTVVDGKTLNLNTFPDGLKYYDLTPGTGPTPRMGQTISVLYFETTLDKKEVDGSDLHGGAPMDVPIGVRDVILGWDEGIQGSDSIPGMRVGGKRRLVIPASLAFGNNSPTPSIPAGATLIVDIKLVAVK